MTTAKVLVSISCQLL